MLDDTIIAGEILLIPIIDQCVNPDVTIISQTQDFTITHKHDTSSSPRTTRTKSNEKKSPCREDAGTANFE